MENLLPFSSSPQGGVLTAALDHQADCVREFKFEMRSGEDCPWLWLAVAWDETPMRLTFGKLAPLLRPISRHWWRADRNSPWSLLPLEESIKHSTSRDCKSGVLEVMGMEAILSWGSWETYSAGKQFLTTRREKVFMPARFLPSACAQDIAQGLEDGLSGLNWAGLESFLEPAASSNMKILLLSFNSDLAPSNGIVKHLWAERAAAHNAKVLEQKIGTYVLILDAPCQGHILNGISAHSFNSSRLVSQMYNVCFTMANVKKWRVIRAGLEQVARSDFRTFLFRRQRPPVHFRDHSRRILEMTLLRHRYIRSRDDVLTTEKERELDALASMLLDILNGDWRLPYLQHYCWKSDCPCKGDVETLVSVVLPLLEKSIFDPMASKTPSTNRWHTYAPAIEGGALGKLLSDIAHRALAGAGPICVENDGAADARQPEDIDWRELGNTKAKDAVAFFSDESTAVSLGVAVVSTEPVDRLSNVLQHADVSGHSVDELLSATGAVRDCLTHLFLLLQPPDHLQHRGRTDWPVDMICHHFHASDEVLDSLVLGILRLASQIWSRLFCLRDIWDWRILLLGSRSGDGPLQGPDEELLREFLDADGCCLGPWFTEHLRGLGQKYLEAGLAGIKTASLSYRTPQVFEAFRIPFPFRPTSKLLG